jgi:ribosomal protein L14E/L6E/L27E
VIVLAGRYAGRKAIVVKTFDDATKEHKFGHALIAGIDKVRRREESLQQGGSRFGCSMHERVRPRLGATMDVDESGLDSTTQRARSTSAVIPSLFVQCAMCSRCIFSLLFSSLQAPLKVTKSMGQKRILKRSRVKPFIKYVNYNHLMPTRYTVTDIDLKNIVKPESLKKADTKETARKELKKTFEDRYLNRGKNTGGVQYFFQKLRF